MAGRAGRRGLDTVGTVILCAFGSEPPPISMLRTMLTGQSQLLKSQFRLKYGMILNLLRVEDMSVEGMIKRSFSEFATQRALTANEYPKLLARGTHTLAKLDNSPDICVIGAEDVKDYYDACVRLLSINNKMLSYVMEATNGTGEGVLQSGRIVFATAARKHGLVNAPALVLSQCKSSSAKASTLICLVLRPESYVPTEFANDSRSTKMPARVGYIGSAVHRYFEIIELSVGAVLFVTSVKYKITVRDLLQENTPGESKRAGSQDFFGATPMGGRKEGMENPFAGMKTLGAMRGNKGFSDNTALASNAGKTIDQVVKYLIDAEDIESNSGVPIIDIQDFSRCGSDVLEFRQLFSQMQNLVGEVRSFQSHRHPGLERIYAPIERKETLRSRVEALRHLLSNESLSLFPDFLQRKAVLRELGYIGENETVNVKGRVACEVNTCDELVATELVFEGILNELEPPEIVAALSSLVFQEKSDDDLGADLELPESLRTCCEKMKAIALNLGHLQKNHGLEIDPLEYSETTLKFGLVHVVYEWVRAIMDVYFYELDQKIRAF